MSRRQLLVLGGAMALPVPAPRPAGDPVAGRLTEALHLHTRWAEQQWDAETGAYRADDLRFTVVLGNAVLLTGDGFDAELAGTARGTLLRRTVATIERFARTNRLAGGTQWGRSVFGDAAAESFLILAARLLWDDLGRPAQVAIEKITKGQAAYAYGLGTAADPLSAPARNAPPIARPAGYAQALAPGVAWAEQPGWRERFLLWAADLSSYPPADLANPAMLDGKPVGVRGSAATVQDGYLIPGAEYDLWRTGGRMAVHFLLAGKPVPQVLLHPPNGAELWRSLLLLVDDAGEPLRVVPADRDHRYRAEVLPLACLAQLHGDRYAARAEDELSARLLTAVRRRPGHRLASADADEPYEAEARAELAVACLLHRYRPATKPVGRAEFRTAAGGTRAFGGDAGLTVQQTPVALAGAVTRTAGTRFVWQPGHDGAFVDRQAAAFLPAGNRAPEDVFTTAYRPERDGLAATVTVLRFGTHHAGFATLPTGTVVYASSGVGTDEGVLSLASARSRTYRGRAGAVTLSGVRGGGGDGGTDELFFTPRPARWIRVLGRNPATRFGYSMWTFSVLDEAGADLALGAMPTASSADVTYPAYNATDGNPATRWAVDRTEQGRADSWLAVDLGSIVTIAGARLVWESAYGNDYVIQTSTDAVTWTDATSVPDARTLDGRWADVDGRAGLVVLDSPRPVQVTATGVIAAAGPAAPVTVEGYVGRTADLPRLAARRPPAAPPGLRASDADGFLTVFNLTADPVTAAPVRLPSRTRLYRGAQVAGPNGLELAVSLPAGAGQVEPPRFVVAGDVPAGTRFVVADSHHVTVTAPWNRPVVCSLRTGGWSQSVRLRAGESRAYAAAVDGPVTPARDLARGRDTFPASPLPPGMSAPARAADGDPGTSWRPGPDGRMVVDLGAVRDFRGVRMAWTKGRRCPVRLETSTDGLTYTVTDRPRTGRYVAVTVYGWTPGDAELVEFAVEA